jgi:hypothetical protein
MSLARIGSPRSANTWTTAFSTQPGRRDRCRQATACRRGSALARTVASFLATRPNDSCRSWFDRTPVSPIAPLGSSASIGTGAREVEGDAMSADVEFRVRHATSYERVAGVSDENWMRPALRAFSFLLPGKARGFRVRDLAEAKAWLAEDGDRSGVRPRRHAFHGPRPRLAAAQGRARGGDRRA